MIRSIDAKRPRIHPTAFISEAAYIVGDVEVGEGTNIWPGAVIRGDYGKIIIGKDCSIQDNCVIHTDDFLQLGDNVLMTHGAVIHGSRVGNNVLIGINAVLLEDAQVGNFCLIGACAVVRAGARVPDHSLVVGVPAQVKPLTEQQAGRLEDPTAAYKLNSRRYIEAGLGLQLPVDSD